MTIYLVGGAVPNKYYEKHLFSLACVNLDFIKLLKKYGFDLHSNDQYILKEAIKFVNYDGFIYLLNDGGDVNQISNVLDYFICNYKRMAYSPTYLDFSAKMLQRLVNEGVDVSTNNELLQIFVSYGNYRNSKIMIDAGSDVSSLKPDHLRSMIKYRSSELIELLITSGVDFTILNDANFSYIPSEKTCIQIYNLLNNIGVDTDVLISALVQFD